MGNEMVVLKMRCVFCSSEHHVCLTENQYDKWRFDDRPIQQILPELSDTAREQLISNICPECQEDLFEPEVA